MQYKVLNEYVPNFIFKEINKKKFLTIKEIHRSRAICCQKYLKHHKHTIQGDSSFTARTINPIEKLVKIMKFRVTFP
jgi:hypothetical protein